MNKARPENIEKLSRKDGILRLKSLLKKRRYREDEMLFEGFNETGTPVIITCRLTQRKDKVFSKAIIWYLYDNYFVEDGDTKVTQTRLWKEDEYTGHVHINVPILALTKSLTETVVYISNNFVGTVPNLNKKLVEGINEVVEKAFK